MNNKVLEIYSEDKELTELIQEWINENISLFYCNYVKNNIKCNL